jgi:hypothetical protein
MTDELVAFADCDLIPVNEALTLVISRHNGNQQIMSPQVVEGMKTCTNFDTLEAHAARLAATRPELGGNQAMAVDALSNLKTAGMLLRAGDICDRLAGPAPRQRTPTRAFIITCDRPAAIERLLDSMLRTGKLSQHDALFMVDDSREPANRAANREAVARFNLRSAKEMFYIGEEAQADLLSGLVEALPEHAVGIRFLLDGSLWSGKKTYGRARNLCLLLSVGYRAILMDDDILCEAVLPPFREPGIGIGSGGMRRAAFFQNEQEMRANSVPAEFDPLSGHASLLGSTFGQALHTLNDGPLLAPQLKTVNAALANVLAADSPILVTQSGALGDTGSRSGHWAVYQDDESIRRLLSAPHGMAAALENGLTWLGTTRPCFYKMPFLSQLTGLDNSHLLPPYFPAFRGEDMLFGAMVVVLHRKCLSLEYPWSVPHLPMEQRSRDVRGSMAATGGMSLLVRQLTAAIDYDDATDPEYNLQFLAREALRIAARSDADLLLDYRSELARGHADQLYLLQKKFASAKQMPFTEWQDYLRRGIREVQEALAKVHSPTDIEGVPEGASEQQLIGEFRCMAEGFAAALTGWSGMREVSSALTQQLISSKKILPL